MRPKENTPAQSGDKVLVARIGAAHGVRGEVKFWTFTEDPFAVLDYGILSSIDGKVSVEVEDLRPVKDALVARLKGVSDRDAVEKLRNLELYISRDRLPPIDEEGTWYYADLVGLSAVTEDGAAIGTVLALHNFGAGDVIEIKPVDGPRTLMLPFTESVVPVIDIKAKRMTVVMPQEIIGEENPEG